MMMAVVPRMADRLIEIIIPNWNGEKMLTCCLQSLKLQDSDNFHITVVDNGSEDGSVASIKHLFPSVRVIELSENTGFAFAVNAGIRARRSPWILLLNNDLEIAPNCISTLEKSIEKYGDYHFFALKMLSFFERDILDGAGDSVMRGGVGYRLGTMEADGVRFASDYDCSGACGGAALYSASFFEKIGLFDEDFFAYLEDVDLNMRAIRQGLSCRFLAEAIVYHIGSATSGSRINPLTVRLTTRNTASVIVKNFDLLFLLKGILPLVAYQLAWFVFCCKKGQVIPWFLGVVEGVRSLPGTMKKRRRILRDSTPAQNKRFYTHVKSSELEAIQSIMARRDEQGKNNVLLKVYSRVFC